MADRPSPKQRHYEPRYHSDISRRNDIRPPVDDAIEIAKPPVSPPARSPIEDLPVRPPSYYGTRPPSHYGTIPPSTYFSQ